MSHQKIQSCDFWSEKLTRSCGRFPFMGLQEALTHGTGAGRAHRGQKGGSEQPTQKETTVPVDAAWERGFILKVTLPNKK